MKLLRSTVVPAVLALAAACGGDKEPKAPEAAAGSGAAAADPDAYRKAQQKFADSVLNATSSAKAVVEKMNNKEYAVGSIRLRDSLALLSNKTDCYGRGRTVDPYLAGTVSYYVFMSVVGSNIVRVQESSWTSPAGKRVDDCLNEAAGKWKFDMSFGKPASYITQVQFKVEAAPEKAPAKVPEKAPTKP